MAAPQTIEFELVITCTGCGRELYRSTTHSEEDAKEAFVKGMTVSELHDCAGTPKA
jgi:hypothetical protein